MKKTLLKLSAVVMSAACIFSSCGKDDPKNNGGLKDPDKEENANLHESLKGSEYVVISLDEETYKTIEKKVTLDLRVDDTSKFLYVWDGTYTGGVCSGLNFYGEAQGWISFVVGTVGWSGAGFNIADAAPVNPFVKDAADMANWKFHFAYKGAAGVPQCGKIGWNGKEYGFSFGDGVFVDNGTSFPQVLPVSGKFVANEWNEYEISISDFGIDYTTTSKGNYFSVLSGGVAGTTLDLDAIFYYKK